MPVIIAVSGGQGPAEMPGPAHTHLRPSEIQKGRLSSVESQTLSLSCGADICCPVPGTEVRTSVRRDLV